MFVGTEELRGGGGRLGGGNLETEACRGGSGSLSSADRSPRSGYTRPGDCPLSMAPSAGDGNIRPVQESGRRSASYALSYTPYAGRWVEKVIVNDVR